MKDWMVFSINSGSALFSKAERILFSSFWRVLGRDWVTSASSFLIRATRSYGVRSAGMSISEECRAMSLVSFLRCRIMESKSVSFDTMWK